MLFADISVDGEIGVSEFLDGYFASLLIFCALHPEMHLLASFITV